MLKGIDISHHQKNIDWGKVIDSGIEFVIIKATEGVDYVDDMFLDHYNNAKKAGLKIGVYHYVTPSTIEDAKAEAADFLKAIKGLKFDIPPVLDFEEDRKVDKITLTKIALTWLWVVEEALKIKPLFYSYPNFIQTKIIAADLKDYPLWIAHYDVKEPKIAPWDKWKFWQYTSSGTIPGINGRVDMNYYDGVFESPKPETRAEINYIQLTKNFSLHEFECKDGSHLVKLDPKLVQALQILRDELGLPIIIDSGYRTPEHNKKVGGSPTSQHLLGKAVDIKVKNVSPEKVAEVAISLGLFTGVGVYKTFTHLDVREKLTNTVGRAYDYWEDK